MMDKDEKIAIGQELGAPNLTACSTKVKINLKRYRNIYWALYFVQILLIPFARGSHAPLLLKMSPFFISMILLGLFLSAAGNTGLSRGALLGIGLLLLIPLVSLVAFIVIDSRIEGFANPKQRTPGKSELSPLAHWPLVLSFIPTVGLAVGVVALWQIYKSHGRLRGTILVIAGMLLNVTITSWMAFSIIRTITSN